MEGRRNQPLQTSPSEKEKVMFPIASRSMKLQDKPNALKSGKSLKQSSSDQHIGSKTPGSYNHKQRPYRDGTGVEELVKYMSNVPAYLQLLERGDSNEEKALNVGVLDWGRLRKWTHNHRPAMRQKGVDSPSTCHAASSSSTHELSNESCKSSSGNSVTQRNQSPSPKYDWSPCAEEDREQTTVGERNSSKFASFLSLEIASLNTSVGQTNLHKTDHSKGHDHSENNLQKNTGKTPNINHAGRALGSQEVNTSIAPTRDCEIPPPSYKKDSSKGTSRLDKSKFQVPQQERRSLSDSPLVAGDRLGDCAAGHGQHVEDFTDENYRFSFESTGSEIKTTELDRSRFPGLLPEVHQSASLSPYAPHSCPLPFNTECTNRSTSGRSQFALPDGIEHPLQVDEAGTIRFRGTTEKSNNVSRPKLYRSKTPDRFGRILVKAAVSVARESSPSHSSASDLNGMIRSVSLRDKTSITNQLKRTACSDKPIGDKAMSNSKGRRSPLRRMLDPLLKPKGLSCRPVPVPESPLNVVRRLSFTDKPPQEMAGIRHLPDDSSSPCTNSCSNNNGRKLVSSTWISTNIQGAVQDEKQCQEASRSRALLRFAWKNGQPLYTFSMNDTDILAAMRKQSICGKTDFECIYTFYYVHELKKKNGGWMNQVSKSKKQALVSNVVGKMKVSCFRSLKPPGNGPKSCLCLREFVLLGAELRPTAIQPTQSLPDSELAAIVIRSQKEIIESCSGDLMHGPFPRSSFNMNLARNNAANIRNNRSSVIAILPGEVHGLSEAGAPSPLIDRWKSGGSCDCGGWDAGCSLTILAENIQENCRTSVTQSSSSTDGMRGAELFVQGGIHDNGPAFSLVAFNEGLYTVEFDSSIALLQAFSVCLALLHSRQPQDLSGVLNDLQHALTVASPRKHQQTRIQGSAPGSYVPHHPPLSPVGRA